MYLTRLHPFNYILISLIGIIGIFVSSSLQQYISIDILMIINLLIFERKIKWKNLVIFIITLLPTIIAFYISTRIFINDPLTEGSNSLMLSCRLFSLAIISFMYILHLPQEKLILNLTQRRILSVNIGFALLAVFNAFDELTKEFNKIRLAYKMRYAKSHYSPKIILPLMVSAARYAHTISISMYTRGINQNRSYYTPKIKYTILDWLILFCNLCITVYIIITNT